MSLLTNRRKFLAALASAFAWFQLPAFAQNNGPGQRKRGGQGGGGRGHRGAQDYVLPPELATFSWLSLVLGRVSDQSVTVNLLVTEPIEGFLEYGTAPGNYTSKTGVLTVAANKPVETVFDKLQPNTQ